MTRIYFILSVVGWAWTIVFLVIVPVRLMWLKTRRQQRGFDVALRPPEQPSVGSDAK